MSDELPEPAFPEYPFEDVDTVVADPGPDVTPGPKQENEPFAEPDPEPEPVSNGDDE